MLKLRTAALLSATLAGLALAGCSGRSPRHVTPRAPLSADWRNMATEADRERLRNWRTAWMTALGQIRSAGQGATASSLGALLDPDRALGGALPPVGDYRCRTIKLGNKGGSGPVYNSYPFFDCRIDAEGEVLGFYKRTGSQRPVGLIFRGETDARAIFLGTLMLGDELAPLQYGQDSARDMAGYVERVGDRRWRLVLPLPSFESTVDVIELIPAP